MSKLTTWKRAPSAFNIFVADVFEELGSLKAASEKWKSLPEEEKGGYEKKADGYRREFLAGNRVVRKTKGADGKTAYEFVKVDASEEEEPGAPKPPAPPKTKRAPNVYQQFTGREDVKEKLKGLSVEERRAKLKELWAEEKASGRVTLKGKMKDPVEGIEKGPVKVD